MEKVISLAITVQVRDLGAASSIDANQNASANTRRPQS